MGEERDKLEQMLDLAPDLSDQIANSISQINDQIDELTEQASAIEVALLDVAETNLEDYLENTKVAEIEVSYGSSVILVYGATFGTEGWSPKGNISDWEIQDATTFVPVYVYEGVGWDSDSTITQLITDYSFGNDYLYRPLTDGASYGIYPNIDSLEYGRGYLQENKDKVDASIDIFERYI